jgi:hypothetical protein
MLAAVSLGAMAILALYFKGQSFMLSRAEPLSGTGADGEMAAAETQPLTAAEGSAAWGGADWADDERSGWGGAAVLSAVVDETSGWDDGGGWEGGNDWATTASAPPAAATAAAAPPPPAPKPARAQKKKVEKAAKD